MRAGALAVAALIAAPRAVQQGGIERLGWLAGCWQLNAPGRVVEENWTAPRGRSMIGVSRTVRGDSMTTYELVILRESNGLFAYEAHPARQDTATFSTRVVSDTAVVFENPAHDFPQRVGYRRAGAASLIAWIEGSMAGRPPRRIEFRYARVACGGTRG